MPKTNQRTETTIIALLFLSLFVSKSFIYIGLILLIISQAFILYKKRSWATLPLPQPITRISITLFAVGVISSLLFAPSLSDFFTFFRKGAIFLLLPLLYYQLKRNNNDQYASYALLVSLVIALSYAAMKIAAIGMDSWHGQRIDSFWDIGRWGELLAYSIAMTIPLIVEKSDNLKQKILLFILLVMSCTFLLLSGNRGPLLALMVSCSLYFIYRRPIGFFILAFTISVFSYFAKDLPQVSVVGERIASIFDLSSNDSNNARLAMWEQGLHYSYYLLTHVPHNFLFGVGIEQFESSFTHFLQEHANINEIVQHTNHQFSFKDLHNTYLDLSVKLGFLYAMIFILLLFSLFVAFYRELETGSVWAYSGVCLIITYAINALFYTSGLEYQTTIFFLMLALCHTLLIQDLAKRQNRCSKPAS